jgi:predicted nucleic acid-binding protein
VSNTSPLISLAAAGLLDLLGQLYGEVVIPQAVRDEYEAGRQAGDPALEELGWITVIATTPDPMLPDALDPGESAAITIAIARDARAVLLDERLGRRVAARLGLPVVGTLAVLLRARAVGLLPAVQPVLDELISRGMRVSPSLRVRILREAGEEAP